MVSAAQARERRERGRRGDIPPTVQHGKASTATNWGCRCDQCKQALAIKNAEDARRRTLAKGKTPRSEDPSYRGSRTLVARTCVECGRLRDAHVFHKAGHGSVGNVCSGCLAAQRYRTNPDAIIQMNAKVAARVNSETLEGAHKHRQPWTGPDIELVSSRPDAPVRELAEMLGRSYHAVVKMRRRLRDEDPNTILLAGR